MRRSADKCACTKVAESSKRVCSNCGHIEPTAIPFSRSGKDFDVCRQHDKPVPVLTELSQRHFVDERGYTVCRSCGFVANEFSAEASIAYAPKTPDFNVYARLASRESGYLPKTRGKSGKRLDDIVIGHSRRTQIVRSAGALRDAEALCSMSDIRGDTQRAILAAVEAYYDGSQRRLRVRIEAALIAIAELVCSRFGYAFDLAKAASAFNVSNDQIRTARNSVGRWFDTYWVN